MLHIIYVITNSIPVYLRLDSGPRFHLLALTASLLETNRPTWCQRWKVSIGCRLEITLTRSSSKTPCLILWRISRDAVSNAVSTLLPDFALASKNSNPSFLAHSFASSVETSLRRLDASSPSSSHRSILFPTSMQVKWGSACSRTSASHDCVLVKPV